MTKIIKAKFKISRRLGCSLWGSPKDAFVAKNYGPGQHGPENKNRPPSDFKKQLQAKQRLKGYYGYMSEKQFRNIYKEANRLRGDTGANLISLLERRLDAVVYRMNLSATIFGARQLVSHKHILVNGKKVNIPSYRLKEGDVITVTEKTKQMTVVMESTQKMERSVPEYIQFDNKAMEGKLVRFPTGLQEVPYPVMMEPSLVVEFFSR